MLSFFTNLSLNCTGRHCSQSAHSVYTLWPLAPALQGVGRAGFQPQGKTRLGNGSLETGCSLDSTREWVPRNRVFTGFNLGMGPSKQGVHWILLGNGSLETGCSLDQTWEWVPRNRVFTEFNWEWVPRNRVFTGFCLGMGLSKEGVHWIKLGIGSFETGCSLDSTWKWVSRNRVSTGIKWHGRTFVNTVMNFLVLCHQEYFDQLSYYQMLQDDSDPRR
jgi:hypothetical protein